MPRHLEEQTSNDSVEWKNLLFLVLFLLVISAAISLTREPRLRLDIEAKHLEELYSESIRASEPLVPNFQKARFAPFKDVKFSLAEKDLIRIQAKVFGIDAQGEEHVGELVALARQYPEIGAFKFEYLNVRDVGQDGKYLTD